MDKDPPMDGLQLPAVNLIVVGSIDTKRMVTDFGQHPFIGVGILEIPDVQTIIDAKEEIRKNPPSAA